MDRIISPFRSTVHFLWTNMAPSPSMVRTRQTYSWNGQVGQRPLYGCSWDMAEEGVRLSVQAFYSTLLERFGVPLEIAQRLMDLDEAGHAITCNSFALLSVKISCTRRGTTCCFFWLLTAMQFCVLLLPRARSRCTPVHSAAFGDVVGDFYCCLL